MLNKNGLENLKNWYYINPDYAFDIKSIIDETMNFLGEDEAEIAEFIEGADKYMLSFLALSADKISERFRSDKMQNLIKIISEKELG